MNDGFNKMKELLLSDEEFRGKLKAAYEAYKGDQTDESVFNEVLVPLAAEYGITATYDEYKEYIRSVPDDEELSPEELDQVAGGDKMKGFGGAVCNPSGKQRLPVWPGYSMAA